MQESAKKLSAKYPIAPATVIESRRKKRNPKLSAFKKAEYAACKAKGLLDVQDFQRIEAVIMPAIMNLNETNWYPELRGELLYLLGVAQQCQGLQLAAEQTLTQAAGLINEPCRKQQILLTLQIVRQGEAALRNVVLFNQASRN
ncbi:MAG: hypothetical protein ACRDHZ_00640 [Ktedonobacteraceae bacterium]